MREHVPASAAETAAKERTEAATSPAERTIGRRAHTRPGGRLAPPPLPAPAPHFEFATLRLHHDEPAYASMAALLDAWTRTVLVTNTPPTGTPSTVLLS